MKIFLSVLVLIFSLQSWTKADEINEYTIEGMSIGDSALDFFSEERLEERKKVGFVYPNKDFFSATMYNDPKFEIYDNVQFHFKNNDSNYIIYSIAGQVDYKNNTISDCYGELESISSEFKNDFDYENFVDTGIIEHIDDQSGKVRSVFITLKSKDEIVIECYDYTKEVEEKGLKDHMLIAIDSKEFSHWLHKVAYK